MSKTFIKIHILDLAGSEYHCNGSNGLLLSEASCINRSLSALEQVITSLSKSTKHVPYRRSLLTHFLKNSFEGRSKSMLIGNIWPCRKHINGTIKTLRFARRLKHVRIYEHKVFKNKNPDTRILEQKMQILKEQLVLHDELYNRSILGKIVAPSHFEDYSMCEAKVKQYINCEIETIHFTSIAEVHAIFSIFRKLCVKNNTLKKNSSDIDEQKDKTKCGRFAVERERHQNTTGKIESRNLEVVSTPTLKNDGQIMRLILLAKDERHKANKVIKEIDSQILRLSTESNRVEHSDLAAHRKLKALKRRFRIHSSRLQKYRDEIRYHKMVKKLQSKTKHDF